MVKQFISIILIVGFVMIGGFSLFSYLNDEEEVQDKRPIPKRLKIIKNTIHVPEASPKKNIEVQIDDIFQVEEVPEILEETVVLNSNEKEEIITQEIHAQLQNRMNVIYKQSKVINTKRGIKAKFNQMRYEDVFLSDMKGNTFYGSNNVEDIDARTILLEEIQKVGKHGGGFIKSTIDYEGTSRYILVKDLELDGLFVGVEIYTRIE